MVGQTVGLVPRDSKHLSIFVLMALDNRLAAYPTEETTTGEFVVRCIEDFITTLDKHTVVVLDNAPIHRCEAVYKRIVDWQNRDLYIFFLPKYSPHPGGEPLNAIETLWRKINRVAGRYEWLRPEHFRSWGRLTKAVKRILKNLALTIRFAFKTLFYHINFALLLNIHKKYAHPE